LGVSGSLWGLHATGKTPRKLGIFALYRAISLIRVEMLAVGESLMANYRSETSRRWLMLDQIPA
jgi:hypothetical protein